MVKTIPYEDYIDYRYGDICFWQQRLPQQYSLLKQS